MSEPREERRSVKEAIAPTEEATKIYSRNCKTKQEEVRKWPVGKVTDRSVMIVLTYNVMGDFLEI
jgi:hypothetical protein